MPKFIKYDYIEDVLVAQTFELEVRGDAGEAKANLTEHSFRAYTPLLRSPREYNWTSVPALGFEHTTLCAYLMIDSDEPAPSLVYVTHARSGDTPLRIQEVSKGKIIVGFRNDFSVGIAEASK